MVLNKENRNFVWSLLAACGLTLVACNTIDLFEKTVAIPGHQWSSGFKPKFSFTIKDSNAAYQLYIIIRHNDKYNFNNIWLTLTATSPDGTTSQFPQIEMPLAAKEKGWLGSGMGDIYEHRIPLTLDPAKLPMNKAGNYTFTLQQIMREDPLQQVLNAGLRIEKKTR